MRDRTYFFPIFLLCFLFTVFIFLLGRIGWLNFFTNTMQQAFFPIGTFVTTSLHEPPKKTTDLDALKQENTHLQELLANKQLLEEDNKALRDQFQTVTPSPKNLLPVHVVGMPGVVPNISFPETLIVDVGQNEGVRNGMNVVMQSSIVGLITKTSSHFSQVTLVTNKQSSFSVKTSATNGIGVAKGQGNGEIIVDNVLLSDTLTVGDTVVTLGNQDVSGLGYRPGLIVGKITSVEKNPSSLFQKAHVIPIFHFDRLTSLFVLIN